MTRFVLTLIVLMALAVPVFAAEPDKAADDRAQRVELARKLDEIKPASDQVKSAIERAAQKVPEADRQAFIDRMVAAIDKQKIGAISIDAMAEVFTAAELQTMLDYYAKPEARSAGEKMALYQGIMQPELTRMMDAALLTLRAGGAKAP